MLAKEEKQGVNLRVAIIGAGLQARRRAPVISDFPDSEINIITAEHIDNAQILASKFGCESGIGWRNVIDRDDVDVVLVLTPPDTHAEISIAAMKAGKHVLCEKPLCRTIKEADDMIQAAIDNKVILKCGFNHRHHGSISQMKEMIDSNEYGNVLWMRGRYGKSVDKSFFDTWRAKKDLAGGGILLDQGIHMLDLFILFGGEFDSVLADVSNLYWNLEIEDNVFAIYKSTKTGIVASLHSTMTQWRHLFSLEIFLEKGYFVLNGLKTSSGTYGDEKLSIAKNRTTAPAATWEDEEHITYHVNDSWGSEVNHFLEAIKNDSPIKVGNSSDALAVMKLIDKTYKKDEFK